MRDLLSLALMAHAAGGSTPTKNLAGIWQGMLYSIDQSRDGGSLNGTWSQGPPLPLELTHATKQAAWPLDPVLKEMNAFIAGLPPPQ